MTICIHAYGKCTLILNKCTLVLKNPPKNHGFLKRYEGNPSDENIPPYWLLVVLSFRILSSICPECFIALVHCGSCQFV